MNKHESTTNQHMPAHPKFLEYGFARPIDPWTTSTNPAACQLAEHLYEQLLSEGVYETRTAENKVKDCLMAIALRPSSGRRHSALYLFLLPWKGYFRPSKEVTFSTSEVIRGLREL